MTASLDSMEVSSNRIAAENDLQEIIKKITDVLELDGDDEELNEIVNCLLENGRQSLTKYEESITPRIYKEIMIGYDNQLVLSLNKYFEKLWELEYGQTNQWFISFLKSYKIECTDVYQCVLHRSVDVGNIYMKNCPILSIVLQLLFEDINDERLKTTTIFDDLWFTITNNGLRSIEKYSEYIVRSVYKQQMEFSSTLHQALREYFRSNVFSSLKELKIRERKNLYESILDSVAEYGWLTDLKSVKDNLAQKSLKLLLEKLSSFYQRQQVQENDCLKATEMSLTPSEESKGN